MPAETQGVILGGPRTHQLLGLSFGVLRAVVALHLESHRPQFEIGDGGERQALQIFLQLEAFQAAARLGEYRPKQRGLHHDVLGRPGGSRGRLGRRRAHRGLRRNLGRRGDRLSRLGLLGLLGGRELGGSGLLSDVHEGDEDQKT